MKKKFDIAIIGAGLAGLLTSIISSKLGFKTVIIDKRNFSNQKNYSKDCRTTALSSGSVKYLNKFGLLENIEKIAGEIANIKVMEDHDSLLGLDFEKDNNQFESMGYVIENKDLYHQFMLAAKKEENLEFIEEKEYKEIKTLSQVVKITLEKDQIIEAKLLIAADGKNSKIRESQNIEVIKKDYQQKAIIFNIKHQKSHQNLALERFYPAGPFAVLPLKDKMKSSIVWTLEQQYADDYLKIDKKSFEKIIQEKMGDYLGEIEIITEPRNYSLDMMVAKKFISDKIAFIGETIHAMHPIAGQGYNLSVRDIEVLMENLIFAFRAGNEINNSQVLEQYQKSRYFDIYSLISSTHILNKLFANDLGFVKIARKIGLSLFGQVKMLKKIAIQYATKGL